MNSFSNFAFTADAVTNDTYALSEMLKQDDVNDFVRAMVKEVQDHEERDHWGLFLRSDMPPRAKTILAIWSFKWKSFPDGRVMKHKARLCAHGGMQCWGIDFWDT